MRLATGWDEFLHAARDCAAEIEAFDLPPLQVAELDGFLALTTTIPCAALHALADACVRATDRHRLPPSAEEFARRHAAGLSADEAGLLARWGYPYVLHRWTFHMTLTDRLGTSLRQAAAAHFADALAMPRRVTDVSVFTQSAPGAPCLIAERIPLGSKNVPA